MCCVVCVCRLLVDLHLISLNAVLVLSNVFSVCCSTLSSFSHQTSQYYNIKNPIGRRKLYLTTSGIHFIIYLSNCYHPTSASWDPLRLCFYQRLNSRSLSVTDQHEGQDPLLPQVQTFRSLSAEHAARICSSCGPHWQSILSVHQTFSQ